MESPSSSGKPEGGVRGESSNNMTTTTTKKPVVLVGMMGVGKSVIGRALGVKLGRPWIDCDHSIEREQGQSIKDIFNARGEAAFRVMEEKMVLKILNSGDCASADTGAVISLGGGAFLSQAVRDKCAQTAITIWLDARLDTLLTRLAKDETRPLLQKDKETAIQTLLAERQPFYQLAAIKINADGATETIIQKITGQLEHHA